MGGARITLRPPMPRPILLVPLVLLACSSSSSPLASVDAGNDVSAPTPDASLDAASDGGALDAPIPSDAPTTDASTGLANGTVGAWQTLSPMPQARANHCSVTAAGYLVVIGGNYADDAGGFSSTDAVHVAALHPDGSLGAWSQAGTTPSPVNSCTAAAQGNTIYLVDGIYDDPSYQGTMLSATLSGAGVLSPWTMLGPLPSGQDAFYSNAWIASDSASTLYAMDAYLPSDGGAGAIIALHVPLSPQLGSWSMDEMLPDFLGHPEYAFTGKYVYALGGYATDDAGNLPVQSAVSGAPIGSGGDVGSSVGEQALPSPVAFGQAVDVDDWLFVVGGKDAVFGSGVSSVLSAQLGSGGSIRRVDVADGAPRRPHRLRDDPRRRLSLRDGRRIERAGPGYGIRRAGSVLSSRLAPEGARAHAANLRGSVVGRDAAARAPSSRALGRRLHRIDTEDRRPRQPWPASVRDRDVHGRPEPLDRRARPSPRLLRARDERRRQSTTTTRRACASRSPRTSWPRTGAPRTS